MDLMFFPRLYKCCCCLPLRVGSLIIGYASIFVSLISLSGVSWSLYAVVTYVSSHQDNNPDHDSEEIKSVALNLYITHAYFLFVLLYYLVISVLLVIGVHLNKVNYMKYYFNTGLVLLVLGLALVVVTCVFLGFPTAIPLLKWCLILFYCLIVVRSAYLEIVEQSKPQFHEMQNLYSPPAPINL